MAVIQKFLVAILVIIFIFILTISLNKIKAATNITSTSPYFYAWDDVNGFWDFYNTQTVTISGTKVAGYASATGIGDLSLDCFTTRNGNICSTSNYGVCNGKGATHNTDGSCSGADATGNLSGFGWNDNIGWISFCGGLNSPNCPGSIPYGVTIDSNGFLNGYAWNDIVGWISFNCSNNGSCGSFNYAVNTLWRSTSTVGYLESNTIDALTTSTLNSITWQGNCGLAGTNLGFQIATSSSPSGPWNFIGPSGTNSDWFGLPCSSSLLGGTSNSCPAPNVPICVTPGNFQARYFRYKIKLQSNLLQNSSPIVNDVILNFSK